MCAAAGTALFSGSEGELVLVCVEAHPRHLERLLDVLGQMSFPVNPEIRHGRPTAVEFPAYQHHLKGIEQALQHSAIPGVELRAEAMATAIHRPQRP